MEKSQDKSARLFSVLHMHSLTESFLEEGDVDVDLARAGIVCMCACVHVCVCVCLLHGIAYTCSVQVSSL
jgi:hypothetical protein